MFTIQVGHSSDHQKDGVWYDLDVVRDEAAAIDAMIFFGGWRKGKSGRFYQSGMGYHDRPIRYVPC